MRASASLRLWQCQALLGQTLQRLPRRRRRCGNLGGRIVLRKASIPDVLNNSSISSRIRPIVSARHGHPAGRGGPDKQNVLDAAVQPAFQWPWSGLRRKMSQVARRKREDDEGDWKYSPEWWGTQDSGWGHNEGEHVFSMPSVMGNGIISVTSHPASTPGSGNSEFPLVSSTQDCVQDSNMVYELLGYEWRVLRFNNCTRQSVAKVKAVATRLGDIVLLQQPNCIAFEYVKSMISSGLAAVNFSGLDLEGVRNGSQKMRILCIGMGGGSLPLFLAHNLPGATVEVVEIDPAVILAAVKTMGFPPCSINSRAASSSLVGEDNRPSNVGKNLGRGSKEVWGEILQRIVVHENDGEAFICEQAKRLKDREAFLHYDLVFIDAYDGVDVVPPELCDRNGPFLRNLSTVLNADHGTVVVNLHTDSAPPNIFERISGKFGPGYDPTRPQGKRVQETAHAYREILLADLTSQHLQDIKADAGGTGNRGLAFTVAVSLQGNISLVVSRGVSMQPDYFSTEVDMEEVLAETLVGQAEKVQHLLNISFDLSKRVSRGFQCVKTRQDFQ